MVEEDKFLRKKIEREDELEEINYIKIRERKVRLCPKYRERGKIFQKVGKEI